MCARYNCALRQLLKRECVGVLYECLREASCTSVCADTRRREEDAYTLSFEQLSPYLDDDGEVVLPKWLSWYIIQRESARARARANTRHLPVQVEIVSMSIYTYVCSYMYRNCIMSIYIYTCMYIYICMYVYVYKCILYICI